MSRGYDVIVILRNGDKFRYFTTGAAIRGATAEEIWFFGWPKDKRSKELVRDCMPFVDGLPRDRIHASLEFCSQILYSPPTCVLTGAPGENPDDCTTHEHEYP